MGQHWRSSRAGESHPHALTEPDVNLAAHPALLVPPSWTALPWSCPPPITGWSMAKAEPVNPCAPGPFQTLLHSYGLIRPWASPRDSGPCGASTWAAPFPSRRHIPRFHTRARNGLTPPPRRTPRCQSADRFSAAPGGTTPPGFDVVPTLSTRPQWFTCVRLSVPSLTPSCRACCPDAPDQGS
jgi:hypothetical protein